MEKDLNYLENLTMCNKVVYEDSEFKITKIWDCRNVGVYEVNRSGVYSACLRNGKRTLVSIDGKRLIDFVFDKVDIDYDDDENDKMLPIAINGQGVGYYDIKNKLIIPLKYKYARNFFNGYALVHDGNEWLYIDKKGNEIRLENKYERLEDFSDDMARISTLNIGWGNLAYATDYDDNAGIWGYIDNTGKEIIKPQYIYAFDFVNNRAIVAKGKWTIDKKWDNKYNQGLYWTEEELWGVIDKNGNEIIPCIYDEIKQFMNDDSSLCQDYYIVHVGGWEKGKWAIIDRNGNFITEPIFEDDPFDYGFDMFAFQNEYSREDIPQGIFDLKQNKILFKPQFDDVCFIDKDLIRVQVFDEELGYAVEKIIDKTGKELFKSDYTDIYYWHTPIVAIKKNKDYTVWDIIDKNGNVFDRNEFKEKVSYWNSEVDFETRTYIYQDGEKKGLKNFDGKILVPAKYERFYSPKSVKGLICFSKKAFDYKEGLMKTDGTIIFKPKYSDIEVTDDKKIICNGKNGTEVYEYEVKKDNKLI